MGVSRWGGPESREYPAFSMATRPIRQPPTTKTDLPCVANVSFSPFFFLFFFSLSNFFIFYLTLLLRLSIRFSFHSAILCVCFFPLLSFFFFSRFRLRFKEEREQRYEPLCLSSSQQRRSQPNLQATYSLRKLLHVAMYICVHMCMCAYTDTRESHIDFADD